jgi:glycogen debranching enzyme
MAKKNLAKREGKPLTQPSVLALLANHQDALARSPWSSLTELTNDNGEYNQFSCESQAWSVGCILEALTYNP